MAGGVINNGVMNKRGNLAAFLFSIAALLALVVSAGSFISARNIDQVINESLQVSGEFLKTSRILVRQARENSPLSHVVYVWSGADTIAASAAADLNDIINSFPPEQPGTIPLIVCYDSKKQPRYQALEGVQAFMMAPLYLGGKLWAALSIEECQATRKWTESDRQLIVTLSSLATGALNRNLWEQERDAAIAQAEQASLAKTAFLARMSHEIRTPMNAITGMSELIIREDIPPAAREYALAIKQAGKTVAALLGVEDA